MINFALRRGWVGVNFEVGDFGAVILVTSAPQVATKINPF